MIAIQIHTFVLCNLTVLFPIYVMGASLQCDYVSKGTFSSDILLLDLFFFFSRTHYTPFHKQGSRRSAVGEENWMKSRLAYQTRRRVVERKQAVSSAELRCAAWERGYSSELSLPDPSYFLYHPPVNGSLKQSNGWSQLKWIHNTKKTAQMNENSSNEFTIHRKQLKWIHKTQTTSAARNSHKTQLLSPSPPGLNFTLHLQSKTSVPRAYAEQF